MRILGKIFDFFEGFWDRPGTGHLIGLIILWIYILALAGVEMKRVGIFPAWLPQPPPTHFFSIQLAFTLILALEVLSLIFIIPDSLSRSIGKQLEILTLILLRNAFKELSALPEPVTIAMNDIIQIVDIAASGVGALCVFLCLGFYRRLSGKHHFMRNKASIESYVLVKKLVSLCLLVVFVFLGAKDFYLFTMGESTRFFETIYTVLIFADITMVLIAQRYMPCYYAVFRNSGFVIGTLMMRLSLSAPPILCAAIAVFSALYVVALAWGTERFTPDDQPD